MSQCIQFIGIYLLLQLYLGVSPDKYLLILRCIFMCISILYNNKHFRINSQIPPFSFEQITFLCVV